MFDKLTVKLSFRLLYEMRCFLTGHEDVNLIELSALDGLEHVQL